jgi:hypothetical protein
MKKKAVKKAVGIAPKVYEVELRIKGGDVVVWKKVIHKDKSRMSAFCVVEDILEHISIK